MNYAERIAKTMEEALFLSNKERLEESFTIEHGKKSVAIFSDGSVAVCDGDTQKVEPFASMEEFNKKYPNSKE